MDEYIKKEDIEHKIQDGLNNLVLGHDAIEVLGMIYEMPAAYVAPVRKGRWESDGLSSLKCSDCGYLDDMKMYPSYCPDCGCFMR